MYKKKLIDLGRIKNWPGYTAPAYLTAEVSVLHLVSTWDMTKLDDIGVPLGAAWREGRHADAVKRPLYTEDLHLTSTAHS